MNSLSRWLDVEVGTDEINLNTLASNLALVDLQSDNEYKLLVGDLGHENNEGPKLKVFKGAAQISDISLPDLPLGVVGFYCTETMPQSLPIVAVAYGFGLYMYRNMKLFYKYNLPTIELNVTEKEIWKQLKGSVDLASETMASLIENLRSVPQKLLSPQSQYFLSLSNENQIEYIRQMSDMPCRNNPEVVCITALKMSSVDRHAMSCLVLGTEDGDIIILEPQSFTQEKCVCILKRDWKEGKILFTTEDHIIAIEVTSVDNSVLVICANNTLSCFNRKGKKQWSLSLEHRPISMCLYPILHLGTVLVGVAFDSGHVHLYDGKALVDVMFVRDVASVMRFGQLGREEHVLIIVTSTGNLMLKILKRTADFNIDASAIDAYGVSSSSQITRPWHIPKKSKLFLEQSIRERDNAIGHAEVSLYETEVAVKQHKRYGIKFQWNSTKLLRTGGGPILKVFQKLLDFIILEAFDFLTRAPTAFVAKDPLFINPALTVGYDHNPIVSSWFTRMLYVKVKIGR
ncbi:Bardet-Biedl syndrome 1 protein homolog [Eumeta japonica]|uniref:Bardet-Biedl syndrome 1 protein homolog n=1 Tax=Eumeta variegata TaxID=151549 RepID=A0A4C1ZAH7_EUMVA|nr:Bardet-Biedl syndrome 1 protein homolog [Eumeta japonica]